MQFAPTASIHEISRCEPIKARRATRTLSAPPPLVLPAAAAAPACPPQHGSMLSACRVRALPLLRCRGTTQARHAACHARYLADAAGSPAAAASEAEDKPKAKKKCGCGRSPTGFCNGLHALSKEEWAVSERNPDRRPEGSEEPEAAAEPAAAAEPGEILIYQGGRARPLRILKTASFINCVASCTGGPLIVTADIAMPFAARLGMATTMAFFGLSTTGTSTSRQLHPLTPARACLTGV